ncbi:adhesion G protein-coupled receptor L1-like [Anneissia japonica]|uniref:adhesion G protein-coupled receptor L1-like n=1 Tax=Anneissia japonica TaxID=1529436 RepID=UPI0014255D26|nr:adhesion G protein-coupled receptor L1-like [Anneissia japonica]XP_033123101.1 adhesion G protein-coupled receptor L1-like [Anneissia japonica]XP_033123102.1 adhesion G protein-coupled receptor L1-like [Anneissia japonica]XP_033123103.1 adhesion G protein-coupled receptor L1-like [Anneissia japonica]
MAIIFYVFLISCGLWSHVQSDIISSQCHKGFYKLPKCHNTPEMYFCKCGPGFVWNGEVCAALSANSRLEFDGKDNRTFTVLLGKAFSALQAFTITMWLKVEDYGNSTVLSYNGTNGAGHDITVGVGRYGNLRVGSNSVDFPLDLVPKKWGYLSITYNISGEWKVYQDSILKGHGRNMSRSSLIQGNGDWILGQSKYFTSNQSFAGSLSHVNIWNETLTKSEIVQIHNNCYFKYCGNLVEWVDFRGGTRGHMKLRWPSGIPTPASCERDVAEMCDGYCSDNNGTKCVRDVSHNVLWERARAGKQVTYTCPGLEHSKPPRQAYRNCTSIDKLGHWSQPDMSACVSSKHKELMRLVEEGYESVYNLTERLLEITISSPERNRNPTDLTLEVSTLSKLINLTKQNFLPMYLGDDIVDVADYEISYDEVNDFANTAVKIVSQIIDSSRREAWDATKPRGTLALQVLHVMDSLQELWAANLLANFATNNETNGEAEIIRIIEKNLALHISVENMQKFKGIQFPKTDKKGCASFPSNFFTNWTNNAGSEILVLSITRYNNPFAMLLPNNPDPIIVKHYRDMVYEHAHKEDNINTVILSQRFYNEAGRMEVFNMSVPIGLSMEYVEDFNVSNPACVSLDDSNGVDDWKWVVQAECDVTATNVGAKCKCTKPGIYAITTDMYDVNWRPEGEPRFTITAAAYIGILVNLILSGASLVLYIKLRCNTDTVAVHRNLAVSMFSLHFLFLIGVNRKEVEIVCQLLTIAIHYFFSATFCWICNEAFNLYVEVINSIHADTQQQRPMLRYYIIGWGFPAVLVGALLGSNWNNNYFSEEVCFVNNQHVWLLIGPACGVWAITTVVLIYTGRDIMESAYSKDREENKNVWNHCKGCWVQITLMVIAWGFGLCSLKIYGLVVQILFAMFDILQGAFFFMFFCMLNDEVSRALKDHRLSFTKVNVKSPKLARSSKYSIYRRYVPPGVGSSSEPDPSESYSSKSDEFRGRRPIRRQKFRPIDSSPEKGPSSDDPSSPIKHVMLNMPDSPYSENSQLIKSDEPNTQIEIPKKRRGLRIKFESLVESNADYKDEVKPKIRDTPIGQEAPKIEISDGLEQQTEIVTTV